MEKITQVDNENQNKQLYELQKYNDDNTYQQQPSEENLIHDSDQSEDQNSQQNNLILNKTQLNSQSSEKSLHNLSEYNELLNKTNFKRQFISINEEYEQIVKMRIKSKYNLNRIDRKERKKINFQIAKLMQGKDQKAKIKLHKKINQLQKNNIDLTNLAIYECSCNKIFFQIFYIKKHLLRFPQHYSISSLLTSNELNKRKQKYKTVNDNLMMTKNHVNYRVVYERFGEIFFNQQIYIQTINKMEKFFQLGFKKQKNLNVDSINQEMNQLFRFGIQKIYRQNNEIYNKNVQIHHKNMKIKDLAMLFIIGLRINIEKSYKNYIIYKKSQLSLIKFMDWINQNYQKLIIEIEEDTQTLIFINHPLKCKKQQFCSQNDCLLLEKMTEKYCKRLNYKLKQKKSRYLQFQSSIKTNLTYQLQFQLIVLNCFIKHLNSFQYFQFI